MIVVTGSVVARQDTFDEVRQLSLEHVRRSRKEPGCVSYTAHFVEGEPATVVIYEQFANEAALDQHRNAPHFHQYAIGGLYQKMLERQVENLTAVC